MDDEPSLRYFDRTWEDDVRDAVRERVHAGEDPRSILPALLRADIDEQHARKLLREAHRDTLKPKIWFDLGLGGGLELTGLAITFGTYAAAAHEGTYLIPVGAILLGAFYLVRGSVRAISYFASDI